MNDLLIVLNPRRIEECISAIESLPIDKLWLENYSEAQIEAMWPYILDSCREFDRLLILSDDTIPGPKALDGVIDLLDEGHPVVTGYCNLSENDLRVNICSGTLGPHPAKDAYPWMTIQKVLDYGSDVVPTTFAGFCLTGMSYEMWKRFPYQLHAHGNSADFQLSKRLTATGIPIVAHRDSFVWHVKENWAERDREDRKRLLVGRSPAEMRFDLKRKRFPPAPLPTPNVGLPETRRGSPAPWARAGVRL